MKLKILAAGVAVLAVLSAIAFWTHRPAPGAPADPRIGQPLIDAALLDHSAGLRFSDQGKTIELAREPDGSWRDTSYYGLPADFSKLSSFVGDLSSSKIQRFVTANPERLARLEFKDTKIEILDAGGAAVWSAILGKTADGGGRFVEFGGQPRAYLAPFTAWLDTDPKSWADATLVNLKPGDMARLEISFDQGPALALSRAKKDGAWSADRTPSGQKVRADAVSALLGAVGSLRFSDTSDPSDPAALAARRHERTITLSPFSGPALVIALGRQPESKSSKPAVPPGPVYAFVTSSDPGAPINAIMKKRSFQIDDYAFTSLPQNPADLFEPAAPAAKTAP